MSQFTDETAVERIDDDRWSAHVSDRWNIGANPNGGYLVAIALRALAALGPHGDPMSVTAHFLRPGSGGHDADVHTEVVRSGRSVTTARASLVQEGKARIEVLSAFTDFSAPSPVAHALSLPMPSIPPPDECLVRSGLEQGVDLPILDRVDTLIPPEQARAGQVGHAEVSGWIRLADGAEPDVLSTVLFADAFPPSLFGLLGYIGWVPTIEITVHVRRRPAPGWVLGQFTTSDLHDGRMVENGALWDAAGALIAQSRQIGLLLPQ